MIRKHTRFPLTGQTAVVTGAGSGIGRAVTERLAAKGCPVAIVDTNPDTLKATQLTVTGPVLAKTLDVADRKGQLAFAAEVESWAPTPIGMVFNNAGVTVVSKVVDGLPEDDKWLAEINFEGVVHGVRTFLPLLLRQNSGAIVNTSSVFGLLGMPYQSSYCASKFAVRGFTDALRQELRGTGVRAINVYPGGIKTNIVHNCRLRTDPQFLAHKDGEPVERTKEELAHQFKALARTTPERAAKIILRGVEAGKSRILVGPDAYMMDALSRLAPTRYYTVVELMERAISRR